MDNNKNRIKLKAKHNNCEFIIREDLPGVGYYLYRYENGKDTHDYLQDTIEICKKQAFEEWGVPMDCWEEFKV